MTDLVIEVAETSGGRYLRAHWLNGCLPMYADIQTAQDLAAAERIAKVVGATCWRTTEAEQWIREEIEG
jgi:hypothetical protein